jgi:hypothetical protein
MAAPYVWKFSCDHHFTIAKYEPDPRNRWQVASSSALTVVRIVPNQCPECVWAVQEEEKEKELLAQKEAALVAHKEHGKFLQAQLANSAGDPALNKVFKKLFDDCVLLQAGKVVDILLALDKDSRKPDFQIIDMLKAVAENLVILESAAQIQWKRKVAQVDVLSEETEQLLSKSKSWIALNHDISRLLNADDEVNKNQRVFHIFNANPRWRTAVILAKAMKLDG